MLLICILKSNTKSAFVEGEGHPRECGMVKACAASNPKAPDADNSFMGLAKQGNKGISHPPSLGGFLYLNECGLKKRRFL